MNVFIPERRNIRRIQGKYSAKYRYYYPAENRLSPQEYEALTLDISESGVSLITDRKVSIGETLLIKFSINKEIDSPCTRIRKVILFTGTVVYVIPKGESFFRLGIYFGPPTHKNEVKFFEIVCSSSPSIQDEGARRFLQATLHLTN